MPLEVPPFPKQPDKSWVGPYYYNHPDGEDLGGKLGYTVLLALWGITPAAVVYANIKPNTASLGRLVRYCRFAGPVLGMAATFTCVTYASTRFREKDDEWNYVIGGAAAGSLLGPSIGAMKFTFTGSAACALAGYVKKYHQLRGELVFPPIVREYWSSYYARALDTSLVPDDIRGNWTRSPPPK